MLIVVSVAVGPRVAAVSMLWCLGAYRRLAKPFRKNVRHIILVQPSAFMKLLMAFTRPFVSNKAGAKIKKVGVQEWAGRGAGWAAAGGGGGGQGGWQLDINIWTEEQGSCATVPGGAPVKHVFPHFH